MNDLLFWVVVGLLGLFLYISPGLFIHRMYEGYAVTTPQPLKTTSEVNTAAATSVNLMPSAAPKANSPTHNQIANLMEVLNTPIPLASPTVAPTAAESVGASGQQIPLEYETTASRPQSTREPAKPSEVLKQGDLYTTTLPKIPQPGPQGMLGSMGTQARVPAERVVYIDRERQRDCDDDRCDKPAANPNCPDMRDYIRKDSIPCWGCKLR